MSIVLVAFEGAPTVSEEAVQKERELDEKIEQKIKGTNCYDLHDFSSRLIMIVILILSVLDKVMKRLGYGLQGERHKICVLKIGCFPFLLNYWTFSHQTWCEVYHSHVD